MTIAELRQKLERRRNEKRELDEQWRTLEDEATRRRLIMEVLKQRDENRAIKKRLKDKYKFHWQQESSESGSDDEEEEKAPLMKIPEIAKSIDDATEPTPSTSANTRREEKQPEARTTASKRTTAQPRNQQGRFSKTLQTERETTAELKKKKPPPKKKQSTKIPQLRLISILKPAQQQQREPSSPQRITVELIDPTKQTSDRQERKK